MRNRYFILSAAVVILAFSTTYADDYFYGGGDGSPETPFQIWTAEQMNTIGLHQEDWWKCFILMADLDMSIYTGSQYNIIGNEFGGFTGTFDGNDHIINNLTYISTSTVNQVGLFGYTNSAVIKDLHLENVIISMNECACAGGLVGFMYYGSTTNCSCSASVEVSATETRIGGLVGQLMYGTITNCHSTSSVNASCILYAAYAGGLVGYKNYGTIANCSSAGSISASASNNDASAGGLVGHQLRGSITDCFNSAAVNGFASGHYDTAVGGMVGRNFDAITTNCRNSGSITSTANNNAAVNAGGMAGINLSGTFVDCSNTGSIIVSASGSLYSHAHAGGLIGHQDYGVISYCNSTGLVEALTSSSSYTDVYAGGLMGDLFFGTITNCYCTGSVIASACDNAYAGGLVGYQEGSSAKIDTSYSTGPVTTTGSTIYKGGLLGYQYPDSPGTVTGCFWDMDASGMTTSAGGSGAVGKSTTDMKKQSTFTDTPALWDFLGETTNGTEDIWRMCVDGRDYPRLTWQYAKLGDFECPDNVNVEDLALLAADWLMTYSAAFDGADANGDQIVNLADFTILAKNWICSGTNLKDTAVMGQHWLAEDCSAGNDYCGGADYDRNGTVDPADLAILVEHWLGE